MKSVLLVLGGALLGGLVVANLRRPTDSRCCELLRAGVKQRLGPLGGFAESLGLLGIAPDILGVTGLPG